MRRWVFVLLLLAVPFQLVWGSAAGYCAHEANVVGTRHIGHHEHTHEAGSEVGLVNDAQDGVGAYHQDCESCHLGCSAGLPGALPAMKVLPHRSAASHREPRYDSHVPAGPLRPDRTVSAPAARPGGGVVVVTLLG